MSLGAQFPSLGRPLTCAATLYPAVTPRKEQSTTNQHPGENNSGNGKGTTGVSKIVGLLTHCAAEREMSPSCLRKNMRATAGIRSMMRW